MARGPGLTGAQLSVRDPGQQGAAARRGRGAGLRAAILGYMIKQYGWRELQILPHTLAVRDYAIALPTDSPLKEPINRALLKVIHRPDWKEVVQRYVGAIDEVHWREMAEALRSETKLSSTVICGLVHLRLAPHSGIAAALHDIPGANYRDHLGGGRCMRSFGRFWRRRRYCLGRCFGSAGAPRRSQPLPGRDRPSRTRSSPNGRRATSTGSRAVAAFPRPSGLDDPPTGPALDYEPIGSLAGTMRVQGRRRRFRRVRRAAEVGGARQARARRSFRSSSAASLRWSTSTASAGRDQVHRPAARRHFPRQGAELVRSGDQGAQSRPQASRRQDRRRPSLRRLRHDLSISPTICPR